MSRKPYHRQMSTDWFLKKPFYMSYMLREFTCVGIGLYVLNLMAGIVALAGSEQAWLIWVATQQNPVMIIMALFAFVSSLYHTVTWFATTPKVFKIPKDDGFLPESVVVKAHYAVFAVLAAFLLIVVGVI